MELNLSNSSHFQYYVTLTFGGLLFIILLTIFYVIGNPNIIWKKNSTKGTFNGKTRTFQQFFDENLPTIFDSKTNLVDYYYHSLSENHFYFLISSQNSQRFVRMDHCLQLFFHFLFIFISNTLIVLFFGPTTSGSNSCMEFQTASDCMDNDDSIEWLKMCRWDVNDNSCGNVSTSDILFSKAVVFTALCSSVVSSVGQGLVEPVIKTINDYFSVQNLWAKDKIVPQSDIEEAKHPDIYELAEYDDEFCKFQSRKGTMIKAVRCQLMHKSIDFAPPKRELEELLNPSSKVRAWKQSPESFNGSINICNFFKYQFQAWKYYYYSIGNPDLAYEAVNHLRIHRPDILIQRLRESRKKSEEMRHHLAEPTLTDRDRDALLFRYFLSDWFCGCDQLIAKRLLVDEIVNIPKRLELYSPFIVHKLVVFFMVIVVLTAGICVLTMMVNESLPTRLCLLSATTAHITCSTIIFPLRILYCELLIPQIIRNKFLKFYQVLQVRLKYIAKRDTGLLLRVQSLIQHYHPACRTARLLPWLPMSRILIAMHDFDLPSSTYKEWKPTYRIYSSNTGSPLVVDFLEVISHNISVRIFYAFFRLLHYFLMLVKFGLNSLLLVPNGLRFSIIDIFFASYFFGGVLLFLTQKKLYVPVIIVSLVTITLLCGVMHALQWYWWYPYVQILWENDWLSPKRKSYLPKKPKMTRTIKTIPLH